MKYEVLITDNFHFMDPDHQYVAAEFGSFEDAVTYCENLLRDELRHYQEQNIGTDELVLKWKSFGENPLILGVPPKGHGEFSASRFVEAEVEQLMSFERDNGGPPAYFSFGDRKTPKKRSPSAQFVCSVEWNWSPLHSRQDTYFLHRGRNEWLLWNSFPNDQQLDGYGDIVHFICAACPQQGMSAQDAARKLVTHLWTTERDKLDLDAFHQLEGEGLLEAEQISQIADEVWPEGKMTPSLTPIADAAKKVAQKRKLQTLKKTLKPADIKLRMLISARPAVVVNDTNAPYAVAYVFSERCTWDEIDPYDLAMFGSVVDQLQWADAFPKNVSVIIPIPLQPKTFIQYGIPATPAGSVSWVDLSEEDQDRIIRSCFDGAGKYQETSISLDLARREREGLYAILEYAHLVASARRRAAGVKTDPQISREDRQQILRVLSGSEIGDRFNRTFSAKDGAVEHPQISPGKLIDFSYKRFDSVFRGLCESGKADAAAELLLALLSTANYQDATIQIAPPTSEELGAEFAVASGREGGPRDDIESEVQVGSIPNASSQLEKRNAPNKIKLYREWRHPHEMEPVEFSEMFRLMRTGEAELWVDTGLAISAYQRGVEIGPMPMLIIASALITFVAALALAIALHPLFVGLIGIAFWLYFSVAKQSISVGIKNASLRDAATFQALYNIGAIYLRESMS